MHVTPETVAVEHKWVRDRAGIIISIINDVRNDLSEIFDTHVAPVSEEKFLDEVDIVFADGDLSVNVAALIGLLRDLDVDGDYPGFVIDEYLGRHLAGMIAGGEPLRLLGEATFHFADVFTHRDDAPAGADDLDAALAAGFQTRLPGWEWQKSTSPFTVE